MAAVQSKKTISIDSLALEVTLAKWSAAVAALNLNYHQLTRTITAYNQQQALVAESSLFLGRCPIRQCMLLTNRIQGELEKLLRDMDEENPLEFDCSREYFKKLVAHTIRLDELNKQAQTMMHLASLSAPSSNGPRTNRRNR